MTSYEAYLSSPEWHARARQAKRDAGYECALCSRCDSPLEVHHRKYDRLGHEDPKDLIVLCEVCHRRHHRIFSEEIARYWDYQQALQFMAIPPTDEELN